MTLTNCLLLALVLFSIGLYGVLTRRHLIGMLMSIELMLNAANINFVAFAHFSSPDAPAGAAFALFVIAVSACEMAVALALVLAIYRHKKTMDPGNINELSG
jgi:NADH:ubiquinone oxidoreductase subunit K